MRNGIARDCGIGDGEVPSTKDGATVLSCSIGRNGGIINGGVPVDFIENATAGISIIARNSGIINGEFGAVFIVDAATLLVCRIAGNDGIRDGESA